MFGKCFTNRKATAVLALVALLWAVGPSHAQEAVGQGWFINHPTGSSAWPWNSPGHQGYNEPRYVTQPVNTNVAPVQANKYELYLTTLSEKNTDNPNSATLMAHIPENAKIWVGGDATTSAGNLRTYNSPALIPGKSYSYTVRVDWIEEGKQVSQTHEVSVKAGGIHCVYLIQSDSTLEPKNAVVEANLSKLSTEDRELARAQKFCAVQTGVQLGATGVPFKVMLDKQPVLLCCEACLARAEKDSAKTLAKVKELKAKPETPPGK